MTEKKQPRKPPRLLVTPHRIRHVGPFSMMWDATFDGCKKDKEGRQVCDESTHLYLIADTFIAYEFLLKTKDGKYLESREDLTSNSLIGSHLSNSIFNVSLFHELPGRVNTYRKLYQFYRFQDLARESIDKRYIFLDRVNKRSSFISIPAGRSTPATGTVALLALNRFNLTRLGPYWWNYHKHSGSLSDTINIKIKFLSGPDAAYNYEDQRYSISRKENIVVDLKQAKTDVERGKLILKALYPYEGIGYINPELGKKWFEEGKTYLTPEDVEELMQYKDDPDTYFQTHNFE